LGGARAKENEHSSEGTLRPLGGTDLKAGTPLRLPTQFPEGRDILERVMDAGRRKMIRGKEGKLGDRKNCLLFPATSFEMHSKGSFLPRMELDRGGRVQERTSQDRRSEGGPLGEREEKRGDLRIVKAEGYLNNSQKLKKSGEGTQSRSRTVKLKEEEEGRVLGGDYLWRRGVCEKVIRNKTN